MRRVFIPVVLGVCGLFSTSLAAPPVTFFDDDAEPTFNVDFSLISAPTGQYRLRFDQQNEQNFYVLDCAPNAARLSIVQNGKERVLSSAPVAWKKTNSVTLQRRPFAMTLLVNGNVALRAFDPTWTTGKIGWLTTGAWKAEDARVQPVEAVRFDDDFTRAGDGGDFDWKTPSGKWTLSAASKHVSARTADMSANLFAFAVETSKDWSVATAGRKFWNDYDARVAVRTDSGGASSIGIAADVQDAKNYLAFTLDANSDDKTGTQRLVLVRDGKPTVLASASGGFVPRQWMQLGIRTSPGFVEGLVDGTVVLKSPTNAFGQGGVALLAKGAPALWDDVSVRSYDFLRPQFVASGAWSGTNWNYANGVASAAAPNALLTIGRSDWEGYHAQLSTPWSAASSGAVVGGWKNSQNYALLRWAGAATTLQYKNKIQAVQVVNGQEKIIATAPFGTPEPSTRLEVGADSGTFALSVDGRARVAMPLATHGKFGLKATQKGTRFSDAVIFFLPPPDPPKLASRFVGDGYMLGWASSLGDWAAISTDDRDDKGLQLWNTAELYGPWTLQFPWKATWIGDMEVALFSSRDNFTGGLILRADTDAAGQNITWRLMNGTKALLTTHCKVADLPGADDDATDGASLKLVWSNGLLSLSSTKGTIFSQAIEPPNGSAIGVRTTPFRVRTGALQLWNQNRDDFTFADAPTSFYSPSGKWSVFSRWPCYGDWSFFGGTGRQPRLWTKRTYSGNIVVEYYAHPQMDMPKEPGYSHAGDLNVTVAGDGQSPASGYSFVVSGQDNTRTQIYRAGKLVADNASDKAWFHETINHNEQWHRTWIYVRAEAKHVTQNGKNGVLVSLTVGNDLLCQYFDPQPLENWSKGGRVCFWTLNSTMMLARAKIEAQNMGVLTTPATLRDITPITVAATGNANQQRIVPLVENDESGVCVQSRDGAWRVENEIAGGPFEATLMSGLGTRALTEKTRLSFDWRASKDTRVDVYLRSGDDWHLVELNGNQKPDAMAPSIGKMTRGTAQNGWTPMSFDLGSALKDVPHIDEIRIGAIHGNAYRWQGYDGNPEGAWYELKNVELK